MEGHPPQHRPDSIGAYKIIATLGRGAYGVVYLAEQAHPRRRVALKVLHPDLSDDSSRSRFILEAQTLARLEHPGIARIYEAGLYDPDTGRVLDSSAESADPGTIGGIPFFAMEHVDGRHIGDFAESAGLGPRARLALIAEVCDAVQYAHSQGVLHRDLKPANILVDANARPRVVDFGVARILDAKIRLTVQTEIGELLGTVPYMSPEQALATPDVLDTRSDVYALGVVLYELLSGRLPYDLDEKTIPQALRIISEDSPVSLGAVDRRFRGDLDLIVRTALEKDKQRRYAGAAALADDIRRFLAGEPIVARPPSTRYVLRKLAARHRALVVSGAVVLAAMVAGMVGISYWAIRARDAEGLARRDAQRAEASLAFLQETLSSPGPSAEGYDVTVAEVLADASGKVDRRFADDPFVAATIHRTLAATYHELGLYEEALTEVERFLAVAENVDELDIESILEAKALRAEELYMLGRFVEAENAIDDNIRESRDALGDKSSRTFDALAKSAFFKRQQGQYEQAEALLVPLLSQMKESLDPSDESRSAVTKQLVAVYLALEKTERAKSLLEDAIDAVRKANPTSETIDTSFHWQLALLHRQTGAYDQAIAIEEEQIASMEKTHGLDHPTLLVAANNLAYDLRLAGRLEEAEKIVKDVIERRRRIFGSEDFNTLQSLALLANIYKDARSYLLSASMREEITTILERKMGADHPQTLVSLHHWAHSLIQAGEYERAAPRVAEVVRRYEKVYGKDHLRTAGEYVLKGVYELGLHRPRAAEAVFRRALEIRRKQLPPGHISVGNTHAFLAEALLDQGLVEQASLQWEKARSVIEDSRMPAWRRNEVLALQKRMAAAAKRAGD